MKTQEFLKLNFNQKENLFDDLNNKIFIVGACKGYSMLRIGLKKGANMNNVKSILKKYFDIKYYLRYDYILNDEIRTCDQDSVKELCKYFLEQNKDLDYYSRFDPMQERNKISKVVYRYGQVNYDWLTV